MTEPSELTTELTGCRVILPAPYDRAEWRTMRHGGLGGSEAATALGLNPWKSAYELWLEKTSPVVAEDNEPGPESPMWWGNVLEDDVAEAFELTTGLTAGAAPGLLSSDKRPWQYANPDRLVYDGAELIGVLEVKTTGLFRKHEWEGDDLPLAALLQTHHYLMVTGLPRAWIAGLIGGQSFVCKEIERDEKLYDSLAEHEWRFWQHVLHGTPPRPDGSKSAGDAIKRRYPQATEDDEGVVLNSAEADALREYRSLTVRIKELTKARDQIAQGLQDHLGEHAVGYYDGDVAVRWSNVTTNRLDQTALKNDYPDLFDVYTKPTTSRRFTVVGGKD